MPRAGDCQPSGPETTAPGRWGSPTPNGGPIDGPEMRELYLMCDDLGATVNDLTAKGVTFAKEVTDVRWGRITAIRLPGGGELGLHEARHATAFDLQEP